MQVGTTIQQIETDFEPFSSGGNVTVGSEEFSIDHLSFTQVAIRDTAKINEYNIRQN